MGLYRITSTYSQTESSWKVWLCLLWKARPKQSGRESGRAVIHQGSKSRFKTLSMRPESRWPGDTRSQSRGSSFFWFKFIKKKKKDCWTYLSQEDGPYITLNIHLMDSHDQIKIPASVLKKYNISSQNVAPQPWGCWKVSPSSASGRTRDISCALSSHPPSLIIIFRCTLLFH